MGIWGRRGRARSSASRGRRRQSRAGCAEPRGRLAGVRSRREIGMRKTRLSPGARAPRRTAALPTCPIFPISPPPALPAGPAALPGRPQSRSIAPKPGDGSCRHGPLLLRRLSLLPGPGRDGNRVLFFPLRDRWGGGDARPKGGCGVWGQRLAPRCRGRLGGDGAERRVG